MRETEKQKEIEKERRRDTEKKWEERRDRAKERGVSDDGSTPGEKHEDSKRGQRENDKGERGGRFDWKGGQRGLLSFYQRFLRITFRTFRCPCTRATTNTRPHTYTHTHTRAHIIHPRFLSFLSSPSSPSTSCSILLCPLRCSPYLPLYVVLPSSSSLSLLYVRMSVCVCVYVRASSLNRRTRFHVVRHYAPAARGRLCTWVNGKMSFETFLGRSRSPHCQSYTRAHAALLRKRSPSNRTA